MTATQNIMQHKGYVGSIEVDLDSGTLHGRVQGINDIVHYEANTVPELREAFRGSVDDYLAFCEKDGVEPNRPYSGTFNLRLGPELHRRLATIADAQGTSLNEFVKTRLERSTAEELAEAG